MPAFLIRIGAWVAQILGPLLIDKISAAIKDWKARREAIKQAKADAAKRMEKLNNAKTEKEIDEGVDDSLSKF